MPERA